MQLRRAVEILERLRDGEEPRTGKALPAGGPTQEPDVIRALYTVLAALADGCGGHETGDVTATPKPDKPRLARAGKPWTDEEDRCLAVAFDEGRGVPEIARVLDRSGKAVRLRLVKLGRIAAEDAPAGRRRREPAAASAG